MTCTARQKSSHVIGHIAESSVSYMCIPRQRSPTNAHLLLLQSKSSNMDDCGLALQGNPEALVCLFLLISELV